MGLRSAGGKMIKSFVFCDICEQESTKYIRLLIHVNERPDNLCQTLKELHICNSCEKSARIERFFQVLPNGFKEIHL